MACPGVKLPFEKEVIERAIRDHKGRLAPAARSLGIWRNTLRNFVSKHIDLIILVDNLRTDWVETTLDKVEDTINDAMDNRALDMTNGLKAAFFFANNQGSERGYKPPQVNQQGDIKITPAQLLQVKEMISKDAQA